MGRKRIATRFTMVAVGVLILSAWRNTEPSAQNPSLEAHFLHKLVFGWIDFAERVFPNVSVNPGAVAFASLIAVTTWGVLYWGGRRRWGWTWRAPLALVCAPGLLFAIVLSTTGIRMRLEEIGPNLRLERWKPSFQLRRSSSNPQEPNPEKATEPLSSQQNKTERF